MDIIEITNFKLYTNWINRINKENYIKIYILNDNNRLMEIKYNNIIYKVSAYITIINKSSRFNKNRIDIVCKNMINKGIECTDKKKEERFYNKVHNPSDILRLKLKLNSNSSKNNLFDFNTIKKEKIIV